MPYQYLIYQGANTMSLPIRQDVLKANKPIQYHRNPTQSEIKRGYGAIHYKDIPLENCLKSDLTLKKWIVCPHDGLRYYR